MWVRACGSPGARKEANARCVHGSPLRPIIAAVRKDGNRDCRPAPDAGHRAAGGTLNAGPRQSPPDTMNGLIPLPLRGPRAAADRKSVVRGKRVSVRLIPVGWVSIKKKK